MKSVTIYIAVAFVCAMLLLQIYSCKPSNSCKKSDSSVIIGDCELKEKILDAPISTEPLLLDLDENGIKDMEIKLKVSGSMGSGVQQSLTIKTLHPDCSFKTQEVPDTIYRMTSNDTIIEGGITKVYNRSRTNCVKLDSSYQLIHAGTFEYLWLGTEGSELILDNNWSQGEKKVFRDQNSYSFWPYQETSDLVIFTETSVILNCSPFIVDDQFYFAIKVVDKWGLVQLKSIQTSWFVKRTLMRY